MLAEDRRTRGRPKKRWVNMKEEMNERQKKMCRALIMFEKGGKMGEEEEEKSLGASYIAKGVGHAYRMGYGYLFVYVDE